MSVSLCCVTHTSKQLLTFSFGSAGLPFGSEVSSWSEDGNEKGWLPVEVVAVCSQHCREVIGWSIGQRCILPLMLVKINRNLTLGWFYNCSWIRFGWYAPELAELEPPSSAHSPGHQIDGDCCRNSGAVTPCWALARASWMDKPSMGSAAWNGKEPLYLGNWYPELERLSLKAL